MYKISPLPQQETALYLQDELRDKNSDRHSYVLALRGLPGARCGLRTLTFSRRCTPAPSGSLSGPPGRRALRARAGRRLRDEPGGAEPAAGRAAEEGAAPRQARGREEDPRGADL